MKEDTGRRSSPLRRLYDWTLAWADRPGGTIALFVIAFLESSIFPIPPDVLLIALCVGRAKGSFHFALICTAGSVLGGLAGYGIGFWGYELVGKRIVDMFQGEEVMGRIKEWYDQYGFWGILFAAVTPIPFKIFTIASGYFRFSLGEFMLASVVGRSFRFLAVATALYFFGTRIKDFIDRYFNICALIFMILLLGGIAAVRFMG